MSEKNPVQASPEDAPGAIPLRALNVAPHHGQILVGYVPFGLTAIVGENEEGKSRLLAAVTAIPLETKNPEDLLSITRGEEEAVVGLGTAELRLEERLVGQKVRRRATRQGSAQEGPIHELPDPINLMITGGDHVSADANWRARLKAMNAFYPVPPTEERLSRLAGLLPDPDADIAAELSDCHSAQAFPSLLDAADYLAEGRGGILHRRKREAREEAASLGADLERQGGILAEIIRRAAQESGIAAADPELRRILADEGLADAAEQQQLLERALLTLELRIGERQRVRAEREGMAAARGPRPEESLAQVAQRETISLRVRRAVDLLARARENRAAADRRLEDVGPQIESIRREIRLRHAAWTGAAQNLNEAITGGTDGWPVIDATSFVGLIERETVRLQDVIFRSEGARELAATAQAEVDAAQQQVEACEMDLAVARDAEEEFAAEQQDLAQRQAVWDRLEAQLSGELPPPFASEVELDPWLPIYEAIRAAEEAFCVSPESDQRFLDLARAQVEKGRPRARAAGIGPHYREAEQKRRRIEIEQQEALDRAERLEADATAVWDRLGELISEAIESYVVRVGTGRKIEVRLDSGRWVDVADSVELSKGRLRRAFLDFYLERVEPGERNVVISDDVMLPIGREGREEISQRAAAKRIRLMFEQPRVGDEPRELRTIWYGGAAAEVTA